MARTESLKTASLASCRAIRGIIVRISTRLSLTGSPGRKAGLPVLTKPLSGNASDLAWNAPAMWRSIRRADVIDSETGLKPVRGEVISVGCNSTTPVARRIYD